jgi:hypothetical protein
MVQQDATGFFNDDTNDGKYRRMPREKKRQLYEGVDAVAGADATLDGILPIW